VTFAAKLVATPQREKSGETGFERYDYQALWGLALVFEHHSSAEDYAIAFEFHDDIVLLDSASAPAEARFYQVKTKGSGHWTLTDLARRSPKKKDMGAGKLPSHIGKLYSNYENFPDETRSLNFVSNVPVKFVDGATGIHAVESCSSVDFASFLKKLKEEHPNATETTAKLVHFVRADLSLHDSSVHLKGKLGQFVARTVGTIEYNPDTLYKTIVEECRSRSKYTGVINSFEDLIKYKSITKAQVEAWLDLVRERQRYPEWADVNQGLSLSGLELAAVHREWNRYRSVVLNPGDEGSNRIRDAVRAALEVQHGSALVMADLLAVLVGQTESTARQNMSPFSVSRLRAIILYEVYRDDPTGKIQAVDPQSENQKP
jgi:hypothetical protein